MSWHCAAAGSHLHGRARSAGRDPATPTRILARPAPATRCRRHSVSTAHAMRLWTDQAQPPRAHAQRLSAAAPARGGVDACGDPAAQPQQPLPAAEGCDVFACWVPGERKAQREYSGDQHRQRQHWQGVVAQRQQPPAHQCRGACNARRRERSHGASITVASHCATPRCGRCALAFARADAFAASLRAIGRKPTPGGSLSWHQYGGWAAAFPVDHSCLRLVCLIAPPHTHAYVPSAAHVVRGTHKEARKEPLRADGVAWSHITTLCSVSQCA